MELALRQGFDVKCRRTAQGEGSGRRAGDFEARLADAESYAVHRVRLELARARDRQHAYLRVQDVLNDLPESPERHEAWRLANDQLGLTVQLRAAAGGTASAGARCRRDSSKWGTGSSGRARGRASHIRPSGACSPSSGRSTSTLRAAPAARDELLDARRRRRGARLAARRARRAGRAEGIDEETAKQMLLRLRERRLRRELAGADERDLASSSTSSRRCAPRSRVRVDRGYNPGARRSPVAQLAEHPAVNRRVVGSSPTRGARSASMCAVTQIRHALRSFSALTRAMGRFARRDLSSTESPVVTTERIGRSAYCKVLERVAHSPNSGRGAGRERG